MINPVPAATDSEHSRFSTLHSAQRRTNDEEVVGLAADVGRGEEPDQAGDVIEQCDERRCSASMNATMDERAARLKSLQERDKSAQPPIRNTADLPDSIRW